MILVSLAAGAAVTLYRNDLVHAAMHSIGQEAAFVKLESALGGPSFGTPRAVEQMAAATLALTASAPASETTPSTTSTSTGASTGDSSKPAETGAAESPKPAETAAAEAPKPAEKPAAEPTKSEPSKSEPSKSASAPKTSLAVAHPAPHAASTPENVDPVFKTPKKGKKGKGSEYDPLNPSL